MPDGIYCDGNVRRVPVTSIEDTRGVLSSLEFSTYGFHPVRAFVISAQPGSVRGGHGHSKGMQLLVYVSGRIDVEIVYGGREHNFKLDAKNPALLINSPVWSRQVYHGENPTLIVFCDTPYDPEDYIWSKD